MGKSIVDCSGLGNIDKLLIDNSPQGKFDLFGIHDIRILSISFVCELTNTFGLKNIQYL
jgi:hypothetical protein